MSILSTAATITAIALVAAYGVGQFTNKSIETEIEIAAPAERIWDELTNGAAYGEWNPFVKHLSGDIQTGSTLNVTIQAEGQSSMDFTPEILVADANKELRWVGKLGFPGIFDGEHYFIMEETTEGTTLFRHGENFSGMLTYVLYALIGESTENGFNAMNEALKTRAETRS